jgi:ATP-dependent RNA helicase SUPV3L1/SUV3
MPISFSPSTRSDARARGAGVTAVLGPTNTGKTHLAIERMLAHSSGLIGLPLRLLAREVYNRAVERVGAEAVALITGEEKIKPPNPRFWVATVEAMPRDLDVAFLAVDEIQIAADFERGHVFTDRMLNRRGREETLVLGAATMRPIVERLLPGASIVSRPRLSQLSFAGEKKLTRLPRRSAIVAFSTDEVYAIAELIRRQRGGAAVVLGALSPRTRNAQVELYQSTMSRSPPTASSTAISSASSTPPSWRRSPAVPAAPRATAPSAPPVAVRHSSPNSPKRSKPTPSSR